MMTHKGGHEITNGGYGANKASSNGCLCDDMSFTYAEMCKSLRTKINMLLPDELSVTTSENKSVSRRCKVVGITSALAGEGKTTTAINLAYTLAETGSRICLLEADMRIPNISRRLHLNRTPGLSNLLSGQATGSDIIQKYQSPKGINFFVITAGDIPPMPSEMLDTQNMKKAVELLSDSFDYIVVDLPPITVVTDALVASKYMDGMLVIVREEFCDKLSFQDALSQLELAGAKLLGVILNCSNGPSGHSSYYSSYKKRYG